MADSTSDTPAPAEQVPRRTFLERFGLWISGTLGLVATVAVAVPFVGYLLGPLRKKSSSPQNPWPPWVDLGPVDQFPAKETRMATFENPLGQPWDGMTAHTGVYVRNLGKDAENKHQFQVFAVNCAHLGCPVSWFPQSGLFMCPCHGGVYYENGDHASGPPPRGLFQCEWQVTDGKLEVQAPHFPTLQNTLRKERA